MISFADIQIGVVRTLLLVLTLGGQLACHHQNKTTTKSDDPTQSVSHDQKLLAAQLECNASP